jgi:hypothetical protein
LFLSVFYTTGSAGGYSKFHPFGVMNKLNKYPSILKLIKGIQSYAVNLFINFVLKLYRHVIRSPFHSQIDDPQFTIAGNRGMYIQDRPGPFVHQPMA